MRQTIDNKKEKSEYWCIRCEVWSRDRMRCKRRRRFYCVATTSSLSSHNWCISRPSPASPTALKHCVETLNQTSCWMKLYITYCHQLTHV